MAIGLLTAGATAGDAAGSDGQDVADTVNAILKRRQSNGVFLVDFTEKEDAGEWINDAITYALANDFDSVQLPNDGRLLEVATTIRLRRGVALLGGATFDNTSGTVLTRADGFDDPVIATDKWFEPSNPVDSHYYVIDGICINGNKANNTTGVEAVAFWGVFVGSYIDNLFIVDNLGPGLSIEKNYDCKIGLLWINGCVVGSRASLEIDQTLSAAGPIGIIEISSLYIENQSITAGGGTPQSTPANRGVAIKAGNIGRLNIENYHCESALSAISITHGTNECLRIGQWSGAYLGYASGINCFLRLETSVIGLDIGCGKVSNREAGFKWLSLSASVIAANLYKEYVSVNSRFGGFKVATSDLAVASGSGFWGNLVHEIVGGASSITYRMQTSTSDATRNHYLKGAGGIWSIGSRFLQAADVDFISIESTGGAGDKIRLLQPFVIPARSSAASVTAKSIYEFTNGAQVGPCYQRVGGSATDADYIATVKQTGATSAPTENALYIGQMFVTRGSTPREAYVAVNTGTGATDWRQIT